MYWIVILMLFLLENKLISNNRHTPEIGAFGPCSCVVCFGLWLVGMQYTVINRYYLNPEYAKFAGLAGHVRRILKMSGKGVWSRWTFCPARAFQGQYPANRCPAISLIFAGHFTAPDILQWNVQREFKMSGEGLEGRRTKCPARLKRISRTLLNRTLQWQSGLIANVKLHFCRVIITLEGFSLNWPK